MKNGKFILSVFILCLLFGNVSQAKTSIPKWASGRKIAHAGGGINNTNYTNSVEALTKTLNKNSKVIELDFMFTTDGTLICIHNWNDINGQKLNTDDFLNSKIKNNFTPMTAETALKLLIESKNTYLVVDTKEKDVLKVYKTLNDLCLDYDQKINESLEHASTEETSAETTSVEITSTENTSAQNASAENASVENASVETASEEKIICTKGKEFRKKIIPQIYSKNEYKKIKKIYKYKNWIFTLYKLKIKNSNDISSLALFCKKNGISTVTIPKRMATINTINILKAKKLAVATHTINTSKEFKKFKKIGIDIIYTDFLL